MLYVSTYIQSPSLLIHCEAFKSYIGPPWNQSYVPRPYTIIYCFMYHHEWNTFIPHDYYWVAMNVLNPISSPMKSIKCAKTLHNNILLHVPPWMEHIPSPPLLIHRESFKSYTGTMKSIECAETLHDNIFWLYVPP